MTDERIGEALWSAFERLPRGSGVVFRHYATPPEGRRALFARIAHIARRRGLILVQAGDGPQWPGTQGRHNNGGRGLRTASAHSAGEVYAAARRGAHLVFLSPIFATNSHPGKRALGPLRAAAILRGARLPVIALGGMDERRFTRLRGLGFYGWAGIDAWTTPKTSGQKRNAVPT